MNDKTKFDDEVDLIAEKILELCDGEDSVVVIGSMFKCILCLVGDMALQDQKFTLRHLISSFQKHVDILAEAALENLDDVHDQIMNLPCLDQPGVERNSQIAYKTGHRDARHAAAELVSGIGAGKDAE